MEKKIKIYELYSNDRHGRSKFHGRFASRHRLEAAARGLGLSNWFYHVDEKADEYGGTVIVSSR
jgi:hypothetical protein